MIIEITPLVVVLIYFLITVPMAYRLYNDQPPEAPRRTDGFFYFWTDINRLSLRFTISLPESFPHCDPERLTRFRKISLLFFALLFVSSLIILIRG